MFIRIRNTLPEVSEQVIYDCQEPKPINWIPLLQTSAQSQIASKKLKENNMLFLPDINPNLADQDVLMFVTKGYSVCLANYYGKSGIKIIEIDEFTDISGGVIKMLDESEINHILRAVFEMKPKQVYISLLNSFRNARQEQVLRNILILPGYTCELASKYLDNFNL